MPQGVKKALGVQDGRRWDRFQENFTRVFVSLKKSKSTSIAALNDLQNIDIKNNILILQGLLQTTMAVACLFPVFRGKTFAIHESFITLESVPNCHIIIGTMRLFPRSIIRNLSVSNSSATRACPNPSVTRG